MQLPYGYLKGEMLTVTILKIDLACTSGDVKSRRYDG